MLRHLQMLRDWHEASGRRMVDLVDVPQVPSEPQEDYHVEHVVRFVPKLPEMMLAEVWVTDEDNLGIGIETYARVAERIGVRTNATRFVAGYEPSEVNFDRFISALNLVASGEIVVDCLYLPVFGLTATAKASKDRLSALKKIGGGIPGMYSMRTQPFPGVQRLRFAPWT